MTRGITTWQCSGCGHVIFPRRPVCPRCHGRAFEPVVAENAVVERVTAVERAEVTLASLCTETGPTVVGRLAEPVPPGSAISLTAALGRPGTAFVPDAASSVLPAYRSPLRALEAAHCTVPELLTMQAERYGEKPLFVCAGTRWTYAEAVERAGRAAAALADRGVQRGDRVALLCGNRVELVETVLGCAWLGAVAVPLNTALRGAGLRHTLVDSGARLLVVEAGLLAALTDIELPATLRELRVLDDGTAAGDYPSGIGSVPVEEYQRTSATCAPCQVEPSDTLAILYTSGTTGLPKGVSCPHAQFYWWGVNVAECLEITEDDVLFSCLPLFHTNALNAFFQALVAGATYVVGQRFSASRFWSQVVECEATVTYLLGAMVSILLTRPPSGLDRGHSVRVALAPATPAADYLDFEDRFGVALVEGYGSTETNMVIGANLRAQRPGYMGVVLPGFDARVVDEAGADVPDGTSGELVCRSSLPFAFATGYFGNPAATSTAWQDLWFHTGDRVIRQPGGWFQFVDRLTDSIRRRGENISSLEVEQVLAEHPDVAAVAVYAVPAEMAEDEVMAAVTPRPGAALRPADLVSWCVPRLASFAIPRYVDVVDQLPLTENGKVRKAALRARGVTESTWDRQAR